MALSRYRYFGPAMYHEVSRGYSMVKPKHAIEVSRSSKLHFRRTRGLSQSEGARAGWLGEDEKSMRSTTPPRCQRTARGLEIGEANSRATLSADRVFLPPHCVAGSWERAEWDRTIPVD